MACVALYSCSWGTILLMVAAVVPTELEKDCFGSDKIVITNGREIEVFCKLMSFWRPSKLGPALHSFYMLMNVHLHTSPCIPIAQADRVQTLSPCLVVTCGDTSLDNMQQ